MFQLKRSLAVTMETVLYLSIISYLDESSKQPSSSINVLSYHHALLTCFQFRTFTITMECMFSLINGDDMFATYEEMPDNKTIIFIFSKLYLYSFISLFIYVVLSLFISVIMDTYETVKVLTITACLCLTDV